MRVGICCIVMCYETRETMPDKDLKRHLERMQTDGDYVGKRHVEGTAELWSFEAFVDACATIVGVAAGDQNRLIEILTTLRHHVRNGPKPEPLQIREDVRKLWEDGQCRANSS